MMEVWAAVLIVYGVSKGIAMCSVHELNGCLPLDMAENSVDDMYKGCEDQMKSKAQQYLQNEKNMDSNFKEAWDTAESNYKKKKKKAKGKEEELAIYVYTLDNPKIYPDFNSAVRTQKSTYTTTFKYHALHFFLTSAVQARNARQSVQNNCLTGYRRVNSCFSQNVVNKMIRFGSFTSCSLGRYPKAEKFGTRSCFEIVTCLGADISLYSKFKESEMEVLIPPYEIFKVTEIKTDQKNLQCDVVYKLKSTRSSRSDLNCTLFGNKKSQKTNI